ncbi:MAG: Uma2 family endonuclease [Myxococcaceae bacterium]|nr:Uma2 family endonuclease [Myxococcaceae bacterium]
MTAAERLAMTYPEYLAAEDRSRERHDFIRGEVYAMSGGTPEHSLLSAAAVGELRNALRGRPCVVFEANMRLRNAKADFSCYPDASVVCGAVVKAPDDPQALANPVLVIEVLSDSTEAYDRGTKSAEYRAFASIREIVFISQKAQVIEIHRRNAEGHFVITDYRAGSTVEFASVGVALPIAELYRDLEQLQRLSAAT